MTERGPRKHLNIHEFVEMQHKRAQELGVDVASLLPPANIWKKPRKNQSEVTARKKEVLEPTSPGESWTSVVSDAMKKHKGPLPWEEPKGSVALEVVESLLNGEEKLIVPGHDVSQVWD